MEKFFAKYTVSQILIRSFIALIAAGTFLLVLPICSDDKVTFLEAFFTATSATCVAFISMILMFAMVSPPQEIIKPKSPAYDRGLLHN